MRLLGRCDANVTVPPVGSIAVGEGCAKERCPRDECAEKDGLAISGKGKLCMLLGSPAK